MDPNTQAFATPVWRLVDGPVQRTLTIDAYPFVVGRSPEANLVLPQPFVSRKHAEIVGDGGAFTVRDTGSLHGTFVNGERVSNHRLRSGDAVRFGSLEGPELRFLVAGGGEDRHGTTSHDLLAELQAFQAGGSDLQKLRWFLQAARELNSAGAIDRVLASLLGTTLALAHAERGYVFLANGKGERRLALGMDAAGSLLGDGDTVSQTVIRQAVAGNEQFLITDTLTAEGTALPESIVVQRIRAVICIPLRQRRGAGSGDEVQGRARPLLGVLYLDSRFEPTRFTDVDHELMRNIAREAAALVENAQLAVIEEQARVQEEELGIAAGIQQGLMAVQIPHTQFAEVQAHSLACKAVGGDFFDVLLVGDTLSVALVDVSGKGISAAILASTLQGMLHVQLKAGQPLGDIAAAVNDYLCNKNVGKYATMLLARLRKDGRLEYLNCGHIQPRLCTGGTLARLDVGNLPVGLIRGAVYGAGLTTLEPGARLILVSDGFTEAEDAQGDFFGEERFDTVSLCGDIHTMLEHMRTFCADHPATDDCTLVQVHYRGDAA